MHNAIKCLEEQLVKSKNEIKNKTNFKPDLKSGNTTDTKGNIFVIKRIGNE